MAILALIGLVLAGTLNAQTIRRTVETTAISGKLALADGVIVVQNGDQICRAFGFHYLIGFVDGLKEGADVTLEGYYAPFASDFEYQYFIATALVFNGKTYQLRVPYNNGGMGFNRDMGYNRNMNPWQYHREMPFHRNMPRRNYGDRYYQMNNRGRW